MQFGRIVIGVDFTEASLAAARWAALQFAPSAEVMLVHALPEPDAPAYLRPFLGAPVECAASLAPAFHGGLRGLAGLIGAHRTRIHMAAGPAAAVLATAADVFDADLVCVGRGARRRGSARFGATTAVRLLSRARVATVVVPTGRHEAPARIVAAIDDRPGAQHIVDVACGLAAALEARVDALHALDGDLQDLACRMWQVESIGDVSRRDARDARDARDYRDWPGAWRDAPGPALHDDADALRLRSLAGQWVESLLDHAGVPPGRAAATVVPCADAGQEIAAYVARHRADLVVLGRGGDATRIDEAPGRRPVGSTTRLVAWVAPCPVLVLPLERDPRDPRAGR